MKVQFAALVAWTLTSTDAFVVPSSSFVRSGCLKARATATNEFEYLLNENGANEINIGPRSRRVITGASQKKAQLTSSIAASLTEEDIDEEYAMTMSEDDEEALIAQSASEEFEGDSKLSTYQEEQGTNKLTAWVKQADFQEIVWTLFVPSLLAFAGIKWGLGKVNTNLSDKAAVGLESFTNDMIYHDGNNDEMSLSKLDWDGRLTWLGPTKNKRMLASFMEDYTKRKPVSPQAISTLSYVFSLFGLSEEQAADAMVTMCKKGGAEKISSANKLLFFGNRIFESPEALAKLQEIKDLIKGTYRSGAGADEIVDTSQYAMAEAAYRNLIQKAEKSNKLPEGWQVLGIEQDVALSIYREEKGAGFKTFQEEIYGGANESYNKKGQRIDAEGFVIEEADIEQNEKDAEWGVDEDETASTSGAFECGNCGYTLFVAKGREAKFFGAGFKCPQCGAEKDQFTTLDPDDIE